VDLQQAGLIFLCTLVLGCSASQQIAEEANAISGHAHQIHRLAEQIRHTSQEVESIRSATEIQTEASAITESVGGIHKALPGVKDVVPWWATLLQWALIAAAGAALVWVGTASGAFSAIRVAIGWLPRRKVDEAHMAAATLAQDKPETLREWIAMKRASDKEFDAAWRKANKETP
jgi:hypothetical protein